MTRLPEVTADEIRAIDAVWDAYMAMNAADTPLAWSPSPAGMPDVMRQLAETARAAMRVVGFTRGQAIAVWNEMCDNGSGAAWNIDLLRRGIIRPTRYRSGY